MPISLPLPARAPALPARRLGLVAALCIGQVLLWSLVARLTYSAPEVDSAEQFVWAFSLENGYWKHPPLPTWILHALIGLFGPSVALPFVAAQSCIAIALALTWRLGCEFMSPTRSLVATLLTSLVTYHNIGGDSFNHNTVLLPFQAATLLCFYLAARRQSWHLWLASGLCAGLAMLVKYVALVPLTGLIVYFVLDPQLRRSRRAWLGLLLAAAVFALVLLPHLLWLRSSHFLPFRYAHGVTQALPGLAATLESLADFGFTQLLRLLPFAIGLAIVLWPTRAGVAADEEAAPTALGGGDRLFVWTAALAPLGLTLAVGLFTETALQARWGTNAFLLVGLLAMTLLRRPTSATLLRRCLRIVVAMQLLLCLGQALTKTVLADRFERRTRANFPSAALARDARETWGAHTDAPLRLVVSDIWLGGNLVAHAHRPLAVLIDGRHFKSPWVRDEAIDGCGALVLDDLTADRADRAAPNPALDALMARADFTGVWTLPWARHAAAPGEPERGRVRWGVILPRPGRSCTLR